MGLKPSPEIRATRVKKLRVIFPRELWVCQSVLPILLKVAYAQLQTEASKSHP